MLKKINRINKKKDFDQFFGLAFKRRGGFNVSVPGLILKSLSNGLPYCRVGFIVNNKVDNRSTYRNRVKRQIREVVRLALPDFKKPLDLLFVVSPEIKKYENAQIREATGSLLKRVM